MCVHHLMEDIVQGFLKDKGLQTERKFVLQRLTNKMLPFLRV
ncbi:hypothetical protein [Paenibacillus elgii]|nr:hypothetical protein [Paenibacillus elgii]